MRFPAKGEKDTIIYNSKITVSNIPLRHMNMWSMESPRLNGLWNGIKSQLNADSGIVNDPNDWAKEVGNPRYILDLLLSVINVSVQTVDLVNGLPKLKFE